MSSLGHAPAQAPVGAARARRLDGSTRLQLIHHYGRRIAGRGRGGVLLVSAMGTGRGLPFISAAAAGLALLLRVVGSE